jgi:hypothetical protein
MMRRRHTPEQIIEENGYKESFNGTLRNEPLNLEIFYTPPEAVVLIEQ